MAAAIVFAILMVTVFPALVFVGGGIWSAAMGWLLVEDADARAEGRPA